jgi:hypothetical protein
MVANRAPSLLAPAAPRAFFIARCVDDGESPKLSEPPTPPPPLTEFYSAGNFHSEYLNRTISK